MSRPSANAVARDASSVRPALTGSALFALTTFVLIFADPAAAQSANAAALVQDLEWRTIGPANMVGRITDIEAVEARPQTVFVATASGGIFKSVNGGTTWDRLFQDQSTSWMGDIAVFQPNPELVWVGTGESCTRNSIGWGDGVFKSVDGGETFVNMGLRDTHHISEVVVHPTDPNTVYVAAQGHLWGHAGRMGIFKTTDGGETWTRLAGGLPDDGVTGASDIVMDPSDPNVLYAGFWERLRLPYRFMSGGPNGGLFKSTDAGTTWTKLTNGLPPGESGKIEVDVARTNPSIVYANIEHGVQLSQNDPRFDDMSVLGTGIYRSDDGGASWTYVNRSNPRPFYYSHIWVDPNDSDRIYQLA